MAAKNLSRPAQYDGHRLLSGTIAITIGAMIIASLIVAGVGIFWATRESDAVSVQRQARSVQHAMEASVDELALQQETVAIWDDSATHLAAAPRDEAWIHDNIGGWLHSIFRHDEVFVLDGADRSIYAAVLGAQVPSRRFAARSGDLKNLIRKVRGGDGRGNGQHDRNPSQPVTSDSAVRTTPRATHDSHLMLVGGRPAAASAMLMQPSTANYVRPKGPWPVLISVRFLDGGFLAELSSRQMILGPRFSASSQHLGSEHVIPLKTEWGDAIGFLAWTPELPGSRILWKLVPVNLAILFGLALFMGLLGRRLSAAANELSDAEARSTHLAYHDQLTGLPNRAWFQLKLDELTTGEDASGGFTLALLDVDEFKLTNDVLGHDAGDAVLMTFADRLKRSLHSGDLVARLGGDEFALLLTGARSRYELETYAHDLLARLRAPFEHRGEMIHGRASMGASSCNDSVGSPDILKHADLALYEAKTSGGGTFRLFNSAMWSDLLHRREMLSKAEAALDGNFIEPYYQPKIHLRTGAIVGFEALLRYCVPGKRAKGPECVAAAFEDTDLAVKLSDQMIDRVISDITAWRAAGLPFGHVAINAALAELRRGDFAERLLTKLNRAEVPAQCIQVEITESVLLERGVDHVERTFSALAEHGIKLALDDFGTGFASLTHLKRFPIEIIKIDRSFVRDLQIDAEDGAIVDALIGLGKALKIEVVAEGIETAAQRDFLSALGCTIGQGFLFGHAMPASSIAALLQRPLKSLSRAAA